MNAPDRYELFLLGDNEKKLTHEPDTRVANTEIFTFNKEDHTLGNLLAQRLLKYKEVTFSAYKVPHPLFATFDLRISTDGSRSPKDVLVACLREIVRDLELIKQKFVTEWELKKVYQHGANTGTHNADRDAGF